jgi:hypothetical protein
MANSATINVVVVRKSPIVVVANGAGGLLTGDGPVTLKNSLTIQAQVETIGAETITQLTDVASNSSIANGSTLVYSSANGTFTVEPIPDIDGGSF